MSSTGRGSLYRTHAAYYTPDALALSLVSVLPIGIGETFLEPHLGSGAFLRAMELQVPPENLYGMDVDPSAPGLRAGRWNSCQGDFLTDVAPVLRPDWILGNPPYGPGPLAEAHIRRALLLTGRHVVFLLRLSIMESRARSDLWRLTPLRRVWALQRRPSFTGHGTDSCAYGWFWWDLHYTGDASLGWVGK